MSGIMFFYLGKNIFFSMLVYNFFVKPIFFKINTRLEKIFKSVFFILMDYLKSSFLMMSLLFQSLFFNLFLYNYFSLMTMIFPFTSMVVFCLSLGYIFWSLFFFSNLVNNTKIFLSHFIPSSCPIYLIFFMMIIENISFLIRPLTLSVRLMSNITAGHLMMSFMSISLFSCFLMISLELMVSIIQALVFSLLLVLYSNESN